MELTAPLSALTAAPAAEWSTPAALCAAEHAGIVYLLSPAEWRWAAIRHGWEVAYGESYRGRQVGFAGGESAVLACIAGSNERSDWRINSRACLVDPPAEWGAPGRVHAGFLEHITPVIPLVAREFTDARWPPEARRIVVGHSLGGGAGALLVVALRARGIRIDQAMTFGQPRVGDQEFSEWYDATIARQTPTWRVVTVHNGAQDLVTRLPPWRVLWIRTGYWHLGRPAVVCNGTVHLSRAAWEEARTDKSGAALASWRIVSRAVRRVRGVRRSVTAHFVRGAVEELRKAAGS